MRVREVSCWTVAFLQVVAVQTAQAGLASLITAGKPRTGVVDPAAPRVTVELPVENASRLQITVAAEAPLSVAVVTPAGDRLDAESAESQGAVFAQWDWVDAEGRHVWQTWVQYEPQGGGGGGTYVVELAAAQPLSEPAGYAVGWSTDGGVFAGMAVRDPHVYIGEESVLAAVLVTQGPAPVQGAVVDARVYRRSGTERERVGSIVMADDGTGVDAVKGDGTYSGSFDPPLPGHYEIVAVVRGTDHQGNAFERVVMALFEASDRKDARLTGEYRYEKVRDEKGRVQRVDIHIGVQAPREPRKFRIGALVVNDQEERAPLWVVRSLRGGRTYDIVLSLLEEDLLRLGDSSDYRVSMVDLDDESEREPLRQDVSPRDVLVIPPVKHRELLKSQVQVLRDRFAFRPVDRDGNGRFETLFVSLFVDIPEAGIYMVGADLRSLDLDPVASASSRPYLREDVQAVTLAFDGCEIAAAGVSAPMRLWGIDVTQKVVEGVRAIPSASGGVDDPIIPYGSADFECLCVGDCDGDGSVGVAELVRGVKIVTEGEPIETCPAFDRDWNAVLTVDELISGARSALDGCRSGRVRDVSHGAMFSMWSASGAPGDRVSFPIVVKDEDQEGLAGLNFEFRYPTEVLADVTCLREETLPADYEMSVRSSAGRVKIAYVDPQLHYPAPRFREGVVAVCEARIRRQARPGTYPLNVEVAATADELGRKRPVIEVAEASVRVTGPGQPPGGCSLAAGSGPRAGSLLLLAAGALLLWLARRPRRGLAIVLALALLGAPAPTSAGNAGGTPNAGGTWSRTAAGASEGRTFKGGGQPTVPGQVARRLGRGGKRPPRGAGRRWYVRDLRPDGRGVTGEVAICGASFLSVGTIHLESAGGRRVRGELRDREGRVVAEVSGRLRGRVLRGRFAARNGEEGRWQWRLPKRLGARRLRDVLQAVEAGDVARLFR